MLAFSILGEPPSDFAYTPDQMFWVLPGALRMICHYNLGGAFGWASGKIVLFLAASAFLIPALVLTAYYCRDPKAPLWALGLVVGGAIGNLYDRLFHIGVRDFIEILNPRTGHSLWPVFNVADIGICFGVFVYVIWTILDSRKKTATMAPQQEEGATDHEQYYNNDQQRHS